MESSKRVVDAKAPSVELKRLAKFYAPDRPPRKRLRTLLDFLKHPPGADGASSGNIAVAVQSLLSGTSKDTANNGSGPEHAAAVAEFWAEGNNSVIVFNVVSDCVLELETLYAPHETAFRKQRRKPLEAEDWSEVFEGLEVVLRNNSARLREGWNNNGLTMLFAKLLKRDNHAMIKKYAFRCLALYTDATRSIQQLAAMPSTSTSSFQASRAGSIRLMSDGIEIDIDETEDERSAALLTNTRKNMHLELLRESVDFSPYGGGSIMLPDKFLNEGVHVEGWMRPMPTQAEEPVDMLKFLMDLSLEREDVHTKLTATGKSSGASDRFIFWAELIMKFYMPLLYPKVCLKMKLKEEGDNLGFFHHCPGSFQRVVARWVYKLRSKEDFMEVLWSRREFSEVVMETIRQRFAYRDTELVVDAIKFYSGLCTNAQYVPTGMKSQMNECLRAMISHVSQLFHPSVQLEDSKILLHCIELLELISQRRLDDYTSTYLRKFVLSTIENCVLLREPANRPILAAMLSIVLHVWMHSAVVSKSVGAQVWMELTIALRRWLVNPADSKTVGVEVINCWKRELRFCSCLLMYVMDKGYSYLKVTPDGAKLLPQDGKDEKMSANGKTLRELKQGYLQSSANFLMMTVVDVSDATLLLDRVLHLISPPTLSALTPLMHLTLTEGMLQLVELWIESAIGAQRNHPSELQQISPSTVLALFGEWILPACELEATDFQSSRCTAIVALCKLCSVRCMNTITRSHLTIVARVLFKGITSPSGVVVSTVLQRSSGLFSMNLEGLNILVPAYLYAVDEIIIKNIWNRAETSNAKSSEWNNELNAALDVVFAIIELPKRFPHQDFVRWKQKIMGVCSVDELPLMQDIIGEIPETLDDFHVIVGRILLRIAQLPFTDVVDIKKRALWGLYCLVVMNLKSENTGEHVVDPIHLAEWVVHLVDVCQNADFSISMVALTILQDMSDYHEEVNAFEPSLVARIVMTLAVFAQQQLEEASIEVQAAMERMNTMDASTEGSGSNSKSPSLIGTGLSNSSYHSSNSGARRGSDHGRGSRVESSASHSGETTDAFSKLKNKLKPTTPVTPLTTPSGSTKSPINPSLNSVSTQREQEIPALRLIVQKTSAIFECLRFWIMHRTDILQDADVKKLIFSAIEAALVGTLPDGDWQREVERARTLERRMSMPLLFLGLQMRSSLDKETGHVWLKSFEETAVAAEGLLMHLLHHINGFPSPAGVDQMVSDCSGFNELDDAREKGEKDSPPSVLNFVFMDSLVFSVIGSLDSPCARFIVRDMTGLFTWEIAPAVLNRGAHALISTSQDVERIYDAKGDNSSLERELTLQMDSNSQTLALHRPNGAVQVDFKHIDEGGGFCKSCGGEKPRVKAAPSDAKTERNSGIKLEARQVTWEYEQAVLANNLCLSKSNYVFHDDSSASSAKESGDIKKKDKTRSSEIEKMPGGGNKDERYERLERTAKQNEERNQTGAAALNTVEPQKVICHCPPPTESKFKRRTTTTICGLFDMSINEPNVGNLDDERCLLDLVLDSIPMIFRDCGGDTTDKTLLGGRYAMMRYNLMDMTPSKNPLSVDSAEASGFSFLQRLIHDEECYSQLKTFLSKDDHPEAKELVDFCDAVKKYERTSVPTDRLSQASVIFWEFLTVEGGKKLIYPSTVVSDIQIQIHKAQSALRVAMANPLEDSKKPVFCLPGALFHNAMVYAEHEVFSKSGLMDKYIASMDQPLATSTTGSSGSKTNTSSVSIPPQLALFDSFSIMELNARVLHLALHKRNSDKQLVQMTKAGVTGVRRSNQVSSGSSKDIRAGALDICRLFLSQTGLLPSLRGDTTKKSALKLLDHGPKLERSLKHLDKSPTRETMKIGVIYVGKTQHTQQDILHNEKGSRAYELFLSQLGWQVDMQTHRGFVGGLDTNPKSLSNGRSTLYYASSHSEVIYHVVTMMPTKPSDPQQIDKKRHVGNDYVHIVWSDNVTQNYDPSTITSHFNDVQIVIYPLRKAQRGLFLIKIHTKDKVPPFGPLQSGMVIHQMDLARLVRQTAMNANRVCRSQTMLYVRPYPTRKKLVDEIVERYAVEYKESQLLTMLFGNSASGSTSVSVPSTGD
ncbi:domain-containing protein [Plasmopara halstedii]|uniref:Domain-containing protein n=1 Tax=Plasmopara halstedii TaxID=4781 RepID=A0A0N7L7E7_PLAHL|nr:domain-containing protein [Plasmopara halstedii]CEG46867.1 domain-containing protein [Plasmopara halstedii]|eukprot:XP_024583236.1 domain-containing protein [Plasmopara halstedii]